MILDHLENSALYLPLNPLFAKAFAFLSRPDLQDLSPGKYEIDGERLFAIVVDEPGRERSAAVLEIHERYVDIQYVVGGTDEMGWKPLALCTDPAGDYDREKDARFFNDRPDIWLPVRAGSFAVFFPQDAHTAMVSAENIRKVIVKVAAA